MKWWVGSEMGRQGQVRVVNAPSELVGILTPSLWTFFKIGEVEGASGGSVHMNTPCPKSHMHTCGSGKEPSECQTLSAFSVWVNGAAVLSSLLTSCDSLPSPT